MPTLCAIKRNDDYGGGSHYGLVLAVTTVGRKLNHGTDVRLPSTLGETNFDFHSRGRGWILLSDWLRMVSGGAQCAFTPTT